MKKIQRLRNKHAIKWCFESSKLLIVFTSLVVSSPVFAAQNLFHSSERMSSSLEDFPKWNSVVDRGKDDELGSVACSDMSKACQLENFLLSIKELPAKEQIKRVNSYHNKQRYVEDMPNWGVSDYWATLVEFLKRNGDCEDYAIAKYISLKKLGFDVDNLRIVVLHDQNLRLMHSVLAVYEDDKIYILDNQIKSVLEDTRIHHYTPIYSINERHWWRHLPSS
jgi:predicted transglutaminase-like cysteine proteinase